MHANGLSACIHRGSREIGGSCVELAADGERLVLDLGLPLDAQAEDASLPTIEGLTTGKGPLALILSHGHPDHYGLVGTADASVPVYLGEAAHRILREASFFTPGEYDVTPAGFLMDGEPIRLGPFTATPLLVDHSAYDAYAVLIEAGGRRLLYSGDFRTHGRKHQAMERLIANPPEGIDALLLEGTHVRSNSEDERPGMTEADVETELVALAEATEGMLLVAYSAQNVDRLVSVYRAARRSGRELVIDLYTAAIAEATGRDTIPKAGWNGVHVFVPQAQRVKVKRTGAFERVDAVRACRVFPEDLAAMAGQAVMTFRASMARDLESAGCLSGARAVWSMWPGYLENESGKRLQGWLAASGIPLVLVHASGHATVSALRRLAEAVSADAVIPIHTAAPERFEELFENVTPRADGEWWSV